MLGILHVHSENSLNECPLFIDEIIDRAKKLGYQAMALTDSYNMTGIAEFIKKADKAGIKPIPGVELCVKDDIGITTIVLMAKDYTGYVGLCKLVSEENKTLTDSGFVLPWKKIEQIVGPSTAFYGHIWATSSDSKGVLGRIACMEVTERKKAEAIREEAEQIEEKPVKVKRGKSEEEILSEIECLTDEKQRLEAVAGKNYTRKELDISMETDPARKQEKETRLEAEKQESRDAEKKIISITGKIGRLKKQLKQKSEAQQKNSIQLSKKEEMLKDADQILASIPRQEEIIKSVCEQIKKCRAIFGENFYVELMFHGLEEEAVGMEYLVEAAQQTETKTVISNDVHILDGDKDSILRWSITKALKNNRWEDAEDCARQYRMKTKKELCDMLEGLVPEEVIAESFGAMEEIFDKAQFKWPEDKHYPKYDVPAGVTADALLEQKVRENIPKLFKPGEWTEAYEKRLMEEIPVISRTGYSDYTLIIADIVKEGRDIRHDGEVSDYIGPGRGSGAGSLVNYLMGITKIDPIKNDLFFERYLNVERLSPPDIDTDIATSVRPLMVKYITKKYSRQQGKIGVCTISTKSRLTSKAAVKAAGRALSAQIYGNAAKLFPLADSISKAVPIVNKKAVAIKDCASELAKQFKDDTSQTMIHYAVLIEGLLSSYGTHAAGMIISDNGDVTDYAPVMNVGTQEEPVWNIQFDKEESEEIGLLKLDMLGLTTLDIITNTLKRIYRTKGKWIEPENIPFEQEVFSEIYGKGDTVGVFQCESEGMRKMWMELQPDRIDDIIAGVALYRPGPMDSIPDYIHNKQHPEDISYLAPQLKPILFSTYGIIVYQEQVMRIVRDLGGFSMGRSDLVRRAMAKKKQAIMDKERKNFVYGNKEEGICGCIANGISEEAANKIYDMMISFASYAFNKSHAAAYAVVSYQSAWLKYHYPKEYLIEAMQQQKTDDIPLFINECRRKGFHIICPNINLSTAGFTEKDGDIIYGIGNVKGVKNYSEIILKNREPYYHDLTDFMMRSGANKTAVAALIKAGAFDRFHASRTGMLRSVDILSDKIKRTKLLTSRISEKQAKLDNSQNCAESTKGKIEFSLQRDRAEIEQIKRDIEDILVGIKGEDEPKDRSAMEKEVLYSYISTHPLDQYQASLSKLDPIVSMEEGGSYKIGGMVTESKSFDTKNGQKMTVFQLEDRTGKVKVIIWPQKYDEMSENAKENYIIKIYGKLRTDHDGQLFFDPSFMTVMEDTLPQCIISAADQKEFDETIRKKLEPNLQKQGSRVLLYCRDTGLLSVTGLKVPYEYDDPDIRMTYVRSTVKLPPKSNKKEKTHKERRGV